MRKVLFVTNLPSPYRIDFFNELGRYCDLTVCFERLSASDRNVAWKSKAPENFTPVYLNAKTVGADKSIGLQMVRCVKAHQESIIIMSNYASPSTMLAIAYCRLTGIPYYMEHDGGLDKKDPLLRGLLKKFLLRGAEKHFTTCASSMDYLGAIGIPDEKIIKYPFTSLTQRDLEQATLLNTEEKIGLRYHLGMTEKKIILSVGRFSYDGGYGKGYDVLLKLAKMLNRDVGIYIVGDEPTEEFLQMKQELNLTNVHFIGFKNKKELAEYYCAADLFVLLTRGDVWGLVINEAMMYGLPVVTTTKCCAGLELVEDRINGYLLPLEAEKAFAEKIDTILSDESLRQKMSQKSLERIQGYTIENMAKVHMNYLRDYA